MKSYHPIGRTLLGFAMLLSSVAEANSSSAAVAIAAPLSPQDLLRKMASLAPDECSAPVVSPSTFDVDHSEELLFESVDALLADRLNRPTSAQPSEAASRVRSTLREVEESSSEINRNWPSDDRFHFEVLPLKPAILVRMQFRGHARVVLFGSYYFGKYDSVDPGMKWGPVYFEDPSSRASEIDLFPLHRGPSGRVRFLARVWRSGCAGSIGEGYYGYEWSPKDGQLAEEIIKIEGAQGLDDTASKHVGKLNTTGTMIQLPYCFFSAVDTWDNPTLCAADSFDLSGDVPQFTGRIYNSPDLVVVNDAIHHAEARDYIALRGYCGSDAVAKRLVRDIPPFLFADELTRIKVSPKREKIVFGEGTAQFNLVKRRGEWLLESFRIYNNP